MAEIRVVHYINQFFAGIGGEEKADTRPFKQEGVIGPGTALQAAFGEKMTIVGTVVCGDTYFNENLDSALKEVMEMIAGFEPQLFIAGPAFNAGRYGVACGAVCEAVSRQLNIPVVTGMYEENPGADMYKKSVFVIKTGNSAAKMRQAIPAMAKLALKLGQGEAIGTPEAEGYLAKGIRTNIWYEERGSARAVAMLIKKLRGEDFQTEYPMPVFDRVTPRPAFKDLSKAKIALVTSGGIVPKGNPDHIESSSASKFGTYDLSGLADLTNETHETAHGGYDPVYANLDPDRVLPVDVMRTLENEGVIGSLYNTYYSTVGNGTSVANAKKYAHAIGLELKEAGVDAIILTST